MVVITCYPEPLSADWMTFSFWLYMLFRNFLYPVYISSLTDRLGFKYFGVLLGIGFAASGIAQLFMTALDEWAQGDCHHLTTASASGEVVESFPDCDHGSWGGLHIFQFAQLGLCIACPLLDNWEVVRRKQQFKSFVDISNTAPGSSSFKVYGALQDI